MDKKLAKDLIKTRKSVRQKYQSLKLDVAQSQAQLEKGYKPITEPLQKLLQNIKSEVTIKDEPKMFKSEQSKSFTSTPKKSPVNIINKYIPTSPMTGLNFLEDTYQFDSTNPQNSIAEEQNSSDLINEEVEKSRLYMQELSKSKAYEDYLNDYDPLPRTYIDESVRGDELTNDRIYGVTHDYNAEKFNIGDSELEIKGKDIKVKNILYPGSLGLYELLFKKDPKAYNKSELDHYMDILKRTNAYRRNLDPKDQIQGKNTEKYRTIIRPYLIDKGILKSTSKVLPRSSSFTKPPPPQTRSRNNIRPRSQSFKQGGMLDLSNKKIDYVYYDNPNELVNRLRLLVASQMAGNDGHKNEIASVLEELRELKIIK